MRRSIVPFISLLSFCALPLAAVAASAPAKPSAVPQIIYNGNPVTFIVPPYVGADGELYAPVDFFKLIGASYSPNAMSQTVLVILSNGHRAVGKYTNVDGRCCVAIGPMAESLGGKAQWDPVAKKITVLGKLVSVKDANGKLDVESSFPTTCQIGHLDNPPRIYMDIANTDVATRSALIDNLAGKSVTIRTGQVSPSVTRIVVDLKQDAACKLITTSQTDHMEVALSDVANTDPPVPTGTQVAQLPVKSGLKPGMLLHGSGSSIVAPAQVNPQGADGSPATVGLTPANPAQPAPASDFKVTGVSFDGDDPSHFLITVSTTGTAPIKTTSLGLPTPRLAFDLPGAALDEAVNKFMPVNESVIKDIRTGIVQQGSQTFARVVVDLGQMLGYVVTSRPDPLGTTYLIDLDRSGTPQAPQNPLRPNDLTGQIVVIDPGHGADDSGAVGINGLREKDLTLSIGKKLRDVLTAAGATVHMTRDTDVKPSVGERPMMAIAWHANYFISVHCDESGPTDSHSGTTVYFHAQNAICKRLAQDISGRVGEVSGIPALGVKSDTIRFQTGFGVLRGSPMPAVLVECGYVNDVADAAKLVDDTTQQKIAQGIAAGLRDFVADQTTHQAASSN